MPDRKPDNFLECKAGELQPSSRPDVLRAELADMSQERLAIKCDADKDDSACRENALHFGMEIFCKKFKGFIDLQYSKFINMETIYENSPRKKSIHRIQV